MSKEITRRGLIRGALGAVAGGVAGVSGLDAQQAGQAMSFPDNMLAWEAEGEMLGSVVSAGDFILTSTSEPICDRGLVLVQQPSGGWGLRWYTTCLPASAGAVAIQTLGVYVRGDTAMYHAVDALPPMRRVVGFRFA